MHDTITKLANPSRNHVNFAYTNQSLFKAFSRPIFEPKDRQIDYDYCGSNRKIPMHNFSKYEVKL